MPTTLALPIEQLNLQRINLSNRFKDLPKDVPLKLSGKDKKSFKKELSCLAKDIREFDHLPPISRMSKSSY